jgi:hypothetical protein
MASDFLRAFYGREWRTRMEEYIMAKLKCPAKLFGL